MRFFNGQKIKPIREIEISLMDIASLYGAAEESAEQDNEGIEI